MAQRQAAKERPTVRAQAADAAPKQGSPARVTENLSDMVVRNPAPDGSPTREPAGTYRIISGR